MKYINNRERFIKEWKNEVNINEAFDMSGGSGPMGNDINWGDSLVGRMFNSIFRKIGVGQDLLSINNVIKAIQREFEAIKLESQSSSVNKEELNRLHISFLLEALTKAVYSGTKVSILRDITEETIVVVKDSELQNDDKKEAIKELEDFLKFLEQYDDEIGEDLSEDLTGINKEEEENSELLATGGWGDKTYSGMIKMFTNLIKVVENKDESITTAQGEKEDIDKSKDINYVLGKIVEEIKKTFNEFNNDLLKESESIKWPLLEVSGNKIIYRKSKSIVELTNDKKLMVNIPKWSDPKKGGSGWTGKSEPRLIDFSRQSIERVSSYLVSQLKDIQSVINSDKDFILNEKEIEWFNKEIKGLWLVMSSLQGNAYKTEIGECDSKSKVEFLTKPVKGQSPTNVNTILRRGGIVFKDKKKADEYYDKLFQSGEKVLGKDGKTYKKEGESSPKMGLYNGKKVVILGQEGDKFKVRYEDGKEELVLKVKVSINESIDYLLEKTTLSSEETDANQALKRLKESLNELITTKSKTPAIGIEFLKSINEKATKDFMFKFASEIKSKYNQVSEKIQEKPLYENIQSIDDTLLTGPKEKAQAKGLRDSAAEKIAMFASVSMLFVGEGLYGELGDLGKSLESFNNEFQKLLNTEFTEKSNESRLFKYTDFISINEKKTQQEIAEEIKNYYDENVSYDKWKVTKEEVKSVDDQIKNSKPSAVSYDRIIRIVKLFNKAHKIHTTDVIPSGRRSGKVSNRVFREYEFVGDGSAPGRPVPEGGVEPGIGPYRNKKVFNKFEEAILSIIEDKEFRDFFSEDVTITNKDGKKTEKPGDGKILLKFMNDLLDGNKLYKSGAQSKFFQEYFGFNVKETDFGRPKNDNNKDNKDEKKNQDNLESLKFKKISEEIEAKAGRVYALDRGKHFLYLLILEISNDKVYFKYSEDFTKIDQYIKNKVEKGDIREIKRDNSFLRYAIIRESDFQGGDDAKMVYIEAGDLIRDKSRATVKSDNMKKNDRPSYILVNEKGENVNIPISNSFGKSGDIDKSTYYDDVKTKLKF
jgi:hypothetical protein